MKPIEIDLSGLREQFSLSAETVDQLTETCVNSVASAVYSNWVAEAKMRLNSTLPEYLSNLNKIDKGRFEKQIVLSGVVPNMVEQGASPFDMKEGFSKSQKVRHTIPVYKADGTVIREGGEWYLTIPFRIGVPGTLGQAGFSGEMPSEVYAIMQKRPSGNTGALRASEIPSPYNIPRSRAAIAATRVNPYYAEYTHKNSIYEGLTKRTAQYNKTSQNTYGTFRRVSAASDPLSWIHKGIAARRLAERALERTDVDTIVENEVMDYLDKTL